MNVGRRPLDRSNPPRALQERPETPLLQQIDSDRQGCSPEHLSNSAGSGEGDQAEARRTLLELLRQGERKLALPLLHRELRTPVGERWIQRLIPETLAASDFSLAGELASAYAVLRWGSEQLNELCAINRGELVPEEVPESTLTVAKLSHDVEQLSHLLDLGIVGPEFEELIARYRQLWAALAVSGAESRRALEAPERSAIGPVYNRIVHIEHAPRVERALSESWDPGQVEAAYVSKPPGLVVVDNFLSPVALESLYRFCMRSTIWSSTRHAHGRLGSQFQNGFSCPLLMQVAEELQAALPTLIGHRYPLRHLWGYKSPPVLPADVTTHADFAAVNVNFWLSPNEGNLDQSGGGMVVYGVDAPMHWDFDTYNARLDEVIHPYVKREGVSAVHVPYRCNRAVIFNSDLFHATSEVRFRPEYEFRRINVTYLFGDREADRDFRGLGRPDALLSSVRAVEPWRSAALRGGRRTRR
jgi:hypothetical protein